MNLSLLRHIYTNFTEELVFASQKQKNSLAFICNTLPSSPVVKEGETFQVLAIGGSIYRNALVKKENNTVTIQYEITDKLPVFSLKEEFLSFVTSHVDSSITHLAVNFAYPLEPVFERGRLDGKFIRGMKEHTFSGLENKKVGEEIEKYMVSKHKRNIAVSIANDTICLILSGLTKTNWNRLAAGIVGTGLNFAVFLDKQTVINLETPQFDKFPQTESGKAVDERSRTKGYSLFEKEISGAYLYQHFNYLVSQKQVHYELLTDTSQLSYVAAKNIPGVSDVAREQLERSAALVAAQIAGIASFKKHPLTFIMQGSLFWKGYRYKEMVEEYVHTLIPKYKIDFFHLENSDVLGAAKLIA